MLLLLCIYIQIFCWICVLLINIHRRRIEAKDTNTLEKHFKRFTRFSSSICHDPIVLSCCAGLKFAGGWGPRRTMVCRPIMLHNIKIIYKNPTRLIRSIHCVCVTKSNHNAQSFSTLTTAMLLKIRATIAQLQAGMITVARLIAQILNDRIDRCLLHNARRITSVAAKRRFTARTRLNAPRTDCDAQHCYDDNGDNSQSPRTGSIGSSAAAMRPNDAVLRWRHYGAATSGLGYC